MPERNWARLEISTIYDKLKPYDEWRLKLKEWSKDEDFDIKIIEDDEINFDGVFITGPNPHHTIKLLSDVTVVKDKYGFSYIDYGVCDNATQAIKYYKNLIKTGILSEDKKYIIALDRVYRENEPEHNGWRWHKHGEYIGVQEPTCEYIYNEENIDLVYSFKILELK